MTAHWVDPLHRWVSVGREATNALKEMERMTTATRTWSRATAVERCGLCGHEIAHGEPLLLLKLAVLKRALKRCKVCVGPAPPDLPPLIERTPVHAKPFVHLLNTVDALPLDFKSAAAGREPGEEG